MSHRAYTLETIRRAWIEYKKKNVLRVLRDGSWVTMPSTEVDKIAGTRAEVIKMSVVMSFPEFLEENYG